MEDPGGICAPRPDASFKKRRAEGVRDFLVQTGIHTTIMSTKGFGKADPRVPGDSEQARAANRRVEIGIVDSKLITNGPLVVPK